MPSLTAPVQILCYFYVQALMGVASAILFLINCSSFILYGVTALFGPVFIPSMTQAILGGTAGMADSVSKVGGAVASIAMMAG